MSQRYKPKDKELRTAAARARLKAAVAKLKVKGRNHVLTSHDEGMNDAILEGARKGLPEGVNQWQLPFELPGQVFLYLTVMQPGAIVGKHKHEVDLFRVVVSGSIILDDGSVLTAGDWMYVPAGQQYSLRAGLNPGAITYHCYGRPPGP